MDEKYHQKNMLQNIAAIAEIFQSIWSIIIVTGGGALISTILQYKLPDSNWYIGIIFFLIANILASTIFYITIRKKQITFRKKTPYRFKAVEEEIIYFIDDKIDLKDISSFSAISEHKYSCEMASHKDTNIDNINTIEHKFNKVNKANEPKLEWKIYNDNIIKSFKCQRKKIEHVGDIEILKSNPYSLHLRVSLIPPEKPNNSCFEYSFQRKYDGASFFSLENLKSSESITCSKKILIQTPTEQLKITLKFPKWYPISATEIYPIVYYNGNEMPKLSAKIKDEDFTDNSDNNHRVINLFLPPQHIFAGYSYVIEWIPPSIELIEKKYAEFKQKNN